jgi:histidinol dehydrogenase
MEVIQYPSVDSWKLLTGRPNEKREDLDNIITPIFETITKDGDASLIHYAQLFDNVKLETVSVKESEITEALMSIPEALKRSIALASRNISLFHESQLEIKKTVETMPGVYCWRENRAIEKVGIYIPGGTAPLFSTVLMLGIPAKIAGCSEIILCTPPDKRGKIDPAILYAANTVGINKIVKAGGAQAIAAMTIGTQSIPKVDKIFGPGNQYVTAAKQKALQYGVAIDLPAGPSELLVIADETCIPEFVAADLLSQAEHGPDSQVILVSDNLAIVQQVKNAIAKQLLDLPRKTIAKKALLNSKAIILASIQECFSFSNTYAPEHLILAITKPELWAPDITNAGSVFLGNYSPESAGDYASGTNHTLPTNGYARSYSGVSLDSFVKKITFQKISKDGLQNIGPAIEIMARAEQLFAHKNAITIRLKEVNDV